MEQEKKQEIHIDTEVFPRNYFKDQIALDCLKSLLQNPKIVELEFDAISDFAVRQADSFIKKLNEPEL